MWSIYPLIFSNSGQIIQYVSPFLKDLLHCFSLNQLSDGETGCSFFPLTVWRHFSAQGSCFGKREPQVQLLKDDNERANAGEEGL